MKRQNIALSVIAGMLLAPAAEAGIVNFTGTRANVNPLSPPGTGRCAPLNTVSIGPGALSSTGNAAVFGAFSSTQSHCIAGPPNAANPVRQLTDGQFSYDFAQGDGFFGTYTGTATFANGGVTGLENLIVTGGTGRFLNASGMVVSTGSLTFGMINGATVGIFNGTVNGQLNLPAIPEPATWAMMIVGFALAGSVARRQPRIALA